MKHTLIEVFNIISR